MIFPNIQKKKNIGQSLNMNEAIIHNLLKGKVVSKITIGSVCV